MRHVFAIVCFALSVGVVTGQVRQAPPLRPPQAPELKPVQVRPTAHLAPKPVACDCEVTRKCTCGEHCVCPACQPRTRCDCAVTGECTCLWPGCTCPACEAYRRPAFVPFAPAPPAFTGGVAFVAPRFARGGGGC